MKSAPILLIVVFLTLSARAQYFTGLNGSEYAGITTVNFNPAIANSPFIADINLIGIASAVNNNYVGMDRRAVFHPSLFNDSDFQADHLIERLNGNAKCAYAGTQIQGPLSFMFSFGPRKHRNRNAIGFSYHSNFVADIDNVNQTLARIAYYGFGNNADAVTHFVSQNLSNAKLGIKTLAWNDYGITYSRVVYEKGANLVKVGGTLKLLQPLAGGYIYSKYLSYKWPETGTLNINNTSVNYAYSQGIITSSQNSAQSVAQSIPSYLHRVMSYSYARPSVAVDMGVVYEWNPFKNKEEMEMDCGTVSGYLPKPYKLAVGASIIDFGAVRFKQGTNSGNFYANIQNWNVAKAQFPDGVQSLSDTINARFQYTQNNKAYFTMWLPTRFNLFVDYNIDYGFGVIVSATISPDMSPNGNMVHQVTVFTGTVKYEHKWFGAYIPVSYDVMGNVSLGLTLRAGPLIIGSQDLLGFLMKKYVYNQEVHAALKITIPYHKVHHKYDVRFNKET